MKWQENIDRYLEIEQILNSLFEGLRYCMSDCILKPDPYDHNVHSACCKGCYYNKYDLEHPAYDLLKGQRESLYPTPESLKFIKRLSPCEYHTLNGCILKTHKSPVCIGFLCKEGIEVLRHTYGIFEYDYLGINYALEWILTGDLAGSAYDDFRKTCLSMARRVSGELRPAAGDL